MSMADLEHALRLVADHPTQSDFLGPRDPARVAAAEAALGLTFPPTYRRFVETLGAGDCAGEEFYGVTDGSFATPLVPNAIGATLAQRERNGLPTQYVYVYNLGDGTKFYLDTAQRDDDGECPVVSCHAIPETGRAPVEFAALDFGSYFLSVIQNALTACDDDTP